MLRKGLRPDAIYRKLLGREEAIAYFTLGNFRKRHLISHFAREYKKRATGNMRS